MIMGNRRSERFVGAVFIAWLASCSGETGTLESRSSDSCMVCHNGSLDNDYAGPGIENPHPFDGASTLSCSTCHGGNPEAETQLAAHVPPPPEIGDDAQLLVDR